MLLELIKAVSMLLALSLLQGFVVRFWRHQKIIEQILSGCLFGGICVVGMMIPIEVTPGVIFDPRSVILSMAGLFGGPIVAAISAVIAGGYRLWIGGGGVYVGFAVVIACSLLGLAYRYGYQKGWFKLGVPQLLAFGFIVHVVEVLLFTQLPAEVVGKVMDTVALPLILTFTPATAFLGILLKDVENRFKTETALVESESRLALHLHNTPLAAISWDENFYCTQWNRAAERIFGYTANEAIGKHAVDLIITNQVVEEINAVFRALMQDKRSSRNTNENKTKDGGIIVCDWYNTTILDDSGMAIGVVSLCDDVTEKKLSEELIWEQANYDALTGLANRKLLHDRLQQEIKIANRSNQSVALLFLDLDDFKDVNDTLGHHIGDMLLKEAARRLNDYVREVDTVARLGGDEFTVLMGGLDDFSSVERVASGILEELEKPFQIMDDTSYISTSIGITFYPQDATDSDGLLRNADQAMYAAKHAGRNCFRYFTEAMQVQALARMEMVKDLRNALSNNEFYLHFQPIIELASGEIYKAEALIRWQHPLRGLVCPDEFINLAEETRMIIEIGDWVFRQAALQSSRWREQFDRNFQIAINTSPVQLQNNGLIVTEWLDFLKKQNLSGSAVAVEITEGSLMEAAGDSTEKLLAFRDAGVQVSVDDFGTGYSSLSYLTKFDIDFLKIDRSFVKNLEPESDDLVLCEAIIIMAHKLGLKVVAEGIETSQQYELLRTAGCDYGQGYYLSRPVSAEDFEAMLTAGREGAIPLETGV